MLLIRSFRLEKGREGKGLGEEVSAGKGRQEGENGFTFHISFPLSLTLSHQLLAFRAHLMRNRNRPRRRQAMDNYD